MAHFKREGERDKERYREKKRERESERDSEREWENEREIESEGKNESKSKSESKSESEREQERERERERKRKREIVKVLEITFINRWGQNEKSANYIWKLKCDYGWKKYFIFRENKSIFSEEDEYDWFDLLKVQARWLSGSLIVCHAAIPNSDPAPPHGKLSAPRWDSAWYILYIHICIQIYLIMCVHIL